MQVKTLWGDKVKVFERKNYRRFKTTKAFLKLCGPNDKILDVGCAAGGFCKALKEVVPRIEYVGLDITQSLVECAKAIQPDVNFLIGDVRNLPFGDSSFDIVACWDVLVHVPEYKKALKELYRVSKKYLILTCQLKKEGKTIIDLDKSYQEVGDGRRAYYNIFNMD